MGNRSYLLSKSSETSNWTPRLEANHTLPLGWLMLIAGTDLDVASGSKVGGSQKPGMRLTEGESVGVALDAGAALALAARRGDRVNVWLGAPAGEVVQQFIAYLEVSGGAELYLDLSEWFDGHANHEVAWQWLRDTIATLDAPLKRGARAGSVPRAAAQMLKALEIKAVDHALPWFGQAMAGTACEGTEAWRRYPPRPRRKPDDKLEWSFQGGDPCLISADGSTMVMRARNHQDLATPMVRSGDGQYARLPIDDDVGRIWTTALSADGQVLMGPFQHGNLQQDDTYRYSKETGFETLRVDDKAVIGLALSADGGTVVGYVYGNETRTYKDARPAVWRRGKGELILRSGEIGFGKASLASADGTVIAGEWHTDSPRSVQPFVWSESSGVTELGGDFNAFNWRALSPDGRSGIFRANTVADRTDMTYHWSRALGVRRCDDAQGNPVLEGYACSRRADAVVGLTRDPEDVTAYTVRLWSVDGECKTIDFGSGWSRFLIKHVGPKGDWFCFLASRDNNQRPDHGLFVWHAGKPLQRLAGPEGIGFASFGIAATSDPERPEDLVLCCDCAWPDGHCLLTPNGQERLPFDPTNIEVTSQRCAE